MARLPEHLGSALPTGDPTLPEMLNVLATLGGRDKTIDVAGNTPAAPTVGETLYYQRYATDGLLLPAALQDPDRHEVAISYQRNVKDPVESMTEADALAELDHYLATADTMLAESDSAYSLRYRERIQSMRQNLFFIGRKEFREGAAGIASLWRTYLEKHADLELIVPYLLGSVKLSGTHLKSQELLFSAVMSHFPREDPLRRRILSGRQANPTEGHTGLVVVLDDWVKSGLQVNALYRELRRPETLEIEVHLLAASDSQLRDGIKVYPLVDGSDEIDSLPVTSYFRADDDPQDFQREGPLITGSHSSVDFGFATFLRDMDQITPVIDENGDRLQLPALTRIARKRLIG